LKVRNEVDPDGMFVGEWHRRNVLPPPEEMAALPLEEREVKRLRNRKEGGLVWFGEQAARVGGVNVTGGGIARTGVRPAGAEEGEMGREMRSSSSEESFDILHGAEAEASALLERMSQGELGETELEAETHGSMREGVTGIQVFNKM